MLVIARKSGQVIDIGPDIKVKVIEIAAQGGRVVLGIEAPKVLKVVRSEVADESHRSGLSVEKVIENHARANQSASARAKHDA